MTLCKYLFKNAENTNFSGGIQKIQNVGYRARKSLHKYNNVMKITSHDEVQKKIMVISYLVMKIFVFELREGY